MDILKDKIDTAKDKISEVSDIAIDKVNDAKEQSRWKSWRRKHWSR